MNESGEQIKFKISWYDYIRYAPFVFKPIIKAWWNSLEEGW